MNKFAEIVNHYCATDDWTNLNLGRSNIESVLMKRKDELYVCMSVEKDRLIAQILDLKDAKITVSLLRPIGTIIKEIDQRLIRVNESAWSQLQHDREQMYLYKKKRQAVLEQLVLAAGAKLPSQGYTSFSAPTYSTGANLNNCQVNGDNVYMTLRNIPIDMALEIIQILKKDE